MDMEFYCFFQRINKVKISKGKTFWQRPNVLRLSAKLILIITAFTLVNCGSSVAKVQTSYKYLNLLQIFSHHSKNIILTRGELLKVAEGQSYHLGIEIRVTNLQPSSMLKLVKVSHSRLNHRIIYATYKAERQGSAFMLAIARPFCKKNKICPNWIEIIKLHILIT